MVDSFDIQLISLLEQDARQSSSKLGMQLSASPSTIRRRISELIKQKKIRIIAVPEPKEIGYALIVIQAFQLIHDKINSFFQTLSNRKEVKCLYATSGRFDAIALMWFASTDHLYRFIEKDLPKMEGIKATETFVCLHTEKTF